MILFSHWPLGVNNIIEFENFDGKWVQIIIHPDLKGFGPFEVDFDFQMLEDRYVINIIDCKNHEDKGVVGLFYSQSKFGYTCKVPNSIIMEFAGKIQTNISRMKLGFYRLETELHKNMIQDKQLIGLVWKLDPNKGWYYDSPRGNKVFYV